MKGRAAAAGFARALVLLILFCGLNLIQGAEINPRIETPRVSEHQLQTSHWAFQPILNPPAPAVNKPAWPRNEIDRFILARLEADGLEPAAPADRRTLIRRATFDLTGLPPTPDEIDAFLADSSPDPFAKVVDRLLSSPHYGEHWGRHWLDVVRYADTAGDTADYPVPVAWRYRNYVIDALNSDKPYDEFLREQIAGDILAEGGPPERYAERVTATGYLAISRRFGFDSENYHHLTIQDTIDTLGQSVLGLSLGCARCHDHKYDPVSASEYYGLYGIFASTRYAFPGSEQKQRYRALVPLLPPVQAQSRWREFEARLAGLELPPSTVLRSLTDLDGDFEMQKPAAGGSKGVLVPPWLYEGPVAVSPAAQSPFKNLHPFGNVGVLVPTGTTGYRIGQALHPSRTRGTLHVNLDFRVGASQLPAPRAHRFWIGAQVSSPALEVYITSETLSLRTGESVETVSTITPDQWQNLRLTLDLRSRTVSGTVGAPGNVASFTQRPFSASWSGAIDFIGFDSPITKTAAMPEILLDNIAVQESPITPISSSSTHSATDTPERNAAVEKSKQEADALLAEGPFALAYGVVEGTPRDARLQLRGDPDNPGQEIPRGFLRALGGDTLPETVSGSGRLELAQWLTDPDNPLTARVMVNRLWQYHFGRGLVKTPNDFGTRGQAPTHPELLDHLATQFIRSGWSLKAMHRLLMASATFQQTSAPGISSNATVQSGVEPESANVPSPPVDRFSPFQRRRLSAEELRDTILFVSGELDAVAGRAHPFPNPTGWGYTQHTPFAAVYDHNKRSVYLMTQRIKRHPFLALFDGADPNTSTAQRLLTTVPTQALFFLNDPFVHAKAEKFAERLQAAGADQTGRIEWAYRLALGRFPTDNERAEASEFLAAYSSELDTATAGTADAAALAAYARVLFGSNEFLCVD